MDGLYNLQVILTLRKKEGHKVPPPPNKHRQNGAMQTWLVGGASN